MTYKFRIAFHLYYPVIKCFQKLTSDAVFLEQSLSLLHNFTRIQYALYNYCRWSLCKPVTAFITNTKLCVYVFNAAKEYV